MSPTLVRNLPIAGLIALASCTTPQGEKLRHCNGDDRRPANVYGTILPGAPVGGVVRTPVIKDGAPTIAPPEPLVAPDPSGDGVSVFGAPPAADEMEVLDGEQVPAFEPTATLSEDMSAAKVWSTKLDFASC